MKDEKWIKDIALLFYQIFSVDYENEKFEKKLLQGGGGNSTLCSTWTKLSDPYKKHRISKKAYDMLIGMLDSSEQKLITKKGNVITIPNTLYKKRQYLFSSNEKGAEKRKSKGQYFHRDHNPQNKKVLVLLMKYIKKNKDKEDYLEKISNYIKKIQTIDLITVEEDDIRYTADKKSKYNLPSSERDKLIGSEFYDLIISKK